MLTLEYVAGVLEHKKHVSDYMQIVIDELLKRLLDRNLDLVRPSWIHLPWHEFETDYGDILKIDEYFNNITFIDLLATKTDVREAISQLTRRAIVHDHSKFSPEEYENFQKSTPLLHTVKYNTEEYHAAKATLGLALTHHYQVNDHHPEYHDGGVRDMNMLQQVEMVCDWHAAVKRVKNGDIFTSLEENRQRFAIEGLQYRIIRNTTLDLHRRASSLVV